jgi:hypothetical protein
MPLLDDAEELHLVGSAPLCLALTIDSKAKLRTHYDYMGDPVSGAYARWDSIKIFEPTDSKLSPFEIQASNRFRAKVDSLVASTAKASSGGV